MWVDARAGRRPKATWSETRRDGHGLWPLGAEVSEATAGGQPPGSVGGEVTRLVQAAQEWLRATVGGHAGGGEECRFCPVCRLLAALTADHPDLAERVGAAAGAFVDAVRALFEPGEPAGPAAAETDEPGGHVEPIEIS